MLCPESTSPEGAALLAYERSPEEVEQARGHASGTVRGALEIHYSVPQATDEATALSQIESPEARALIGGHCLSLAMEFLSRGATAATGDDVERANDAKAWLKRVRDGEERVVGLALKTGPSAGLRRLARATTPADSRRAGLLRALDPWSA